MTAVVTPIKKEKAAPQAPPPAGKRNRFIHRTIEAVVALVCVLAIVECLFAMAGVGEQEYLRVDNTLGFVPMEGKHVTWRKEGFGRIQFNSQGRNDIERPIAKPAGTYRIAIIGDSFVESLQVDRKENFLTLMEKDLNERCGQKKHIEVLNFGCSANSPGQFYKKLQTQVLAYQPDLVMIGMSVDATKLLAPIQGGFAFANARPTFILDKQGKLVEDQQVFSWWKSSPDGKRFARTAFLRQYSRIWGAIGTIMGSYQTWCKELTEGKVWGWGLAAQTPPVQAVAVPKEKPKAGSFDSFTRSCGSSATATGANQPTAPPKATIALPQAQGDVAAATTQYWPVCAALIKAMDEDCKKHDCRFVVARLPARPEIGYDNPPETRHLEQLTSELGIPYIDLTPTFLAAPKDAALIYTVHMTPAGHKLVYKLFSDFFISNHLIPN